MNNETLGQIRSPVLPDILHSFPVQCAPGLEETVKTISLFSMVPQPEVRGGKQLRGIGHLGTEIWLGLALDFTELLLSDYLIGFNIIHAVQNVSAL